MEQIRPIPLKLEKLLYMLFSFQSLFYQIIIKMIKDILLTCKEILQLSIESIIKVVYRIEKNAVLNLSSTIRPNSSRAN
jgi:hypothetical protein